MEDFNAIGRKKKKLTWALNDTLDQVDLFDVYRIFILERAEYTFFSSAHEALYTICHILGHKSSLCKFKKIKILSNIFTDHSDIRSKLLENKICKKHKHTKTKHWAKFKKKY